MLEIFSELFYPVFDLLDVFFVLRNHGLDGGMGVGSDVVELVSDVLDLVGQVLDVLGQKTELTLHMPACFVAPPICAPRLGRRWNC